MVGIPSLLRFAEHRALKNITLKGTVIDLGGDANSDYFSYMKGTFTVFRVNMDTKTKPDLLHDLEQPIPLPNAAYDGVVLFNVLEHIFNYRALLNESERLLASGGQMVLVVPFLFPVHPSPDDFHRLTASTLRRELEELNLTHIVIKPLGGGVFSAAYLFVDRLLPKVFRTINFYTFRYLVQCADYVFFRLARMAGKKYDPADYALGFCVTAVKP
jgi:SAM-dependent methyltransferase